MRTSIKALMMRGLWLLAALPLLANATEPAAFTARETAASLEKGHWSVGVFDPLKLGLGGGWEVRAHPLLFFVSPNVVVRKEHGHLGDWAISGEYGVSVPTFALRLTQGYLFQSAGQDVGWLVVPRIGFVATDGNPAENPYTVSGDVAFGLAVTRSYAGPRGTYAPLEVLLAPALGKYRVHLGAAYDHRLLSWLRVRGYGDGYFYGGELGPALTFRAGVAGEMPIGSGGRLTLGVVWWNSDQHALNDQFEPTRSNDFYPTFDFLWRF